MDDEELLTLLPCQLAILSFKDIRRAVKIGYDYKKKCHEHSGRKYRDEIYCLGENLIELIIDIRLSINDKLSQSERKELSKTGSGYHLYVFNFIREITNDDVEMVEFIEEEDIEYCESINKTPIWTNYFNSHCYWHSVLYFCWNNGLISIEGNFTKQIITNTLQNIENNGNHKCQIHRIFKVIDEEIHEEPNNCHMCLQLEEAKNIIRRFNEIENNIKNKNSTLFMSLLPLLSNE